MRIEGDRPLGVERQFGHFVPADKHFLLLAGDRFERGGIDDFLDRLDLAFDFLGRQFEFVSSPFAKTVACQARTSAL